MLTKLTFLQLWIYVDALRGVEQNTTWHPEGDARIHTLQVTHHAVREAEKPYQIVAALCHDLGKIHETHDHSTSSINIIRPYLDTTEDFDKVIWLIDNHMRAHMWLDGRMSKMKKSKDFFHHPLFHDSMLLARWDKLGRRANHTPSITADDTYDAYRKLRKEIEDANVN